MSGNFKEQIIIGRILNNLLSLNSSAIWANQGDLNGFREELQWAPCCVQRGVLIPASAEFGRRWAHLRSALQLWVISSGKSITNSRSQLPPLLAELTWHGGSCCVRENITCKERGWLLRCCILLGMGAPAPKCSLYSVSAECGSGFPVLKTWMQYWKPGLVESKDTAGCRHSLHFWRTAPMEIAAS